MLVELIGLFLEPGYAVGYACQQGHRHICCLWISETLQGLVPWEFDNISKLDTKATGAKVSIDSTIPIVQSLVRRPPSQFALCLPKTCVCVCVGAQLLWHDEI